MLKNRLMIGAAALVIGTAGLSLIKVSEGLKYVSYQDSAGIWTICYGHTGRDVGPNQRATQAQCDALLHNDIRAHVAGVKRCTTYPLTQHQQDAVVSLTFNIGVDAYCRSTMARKLNAGDIQGASNEFPKWNKTTIDGKKVALRGLTTRRLREQALFNTPSDYEITSTNFKALVSR